MDQLDHALSRMEEHSVVSVANEVKMVLVVNSSTTITIEILIVKKEQVDN